MTKFVDEYDSLDGLTIYKSQVEKHLSGEHDQSTHGRKGNKTSTGNKKGKSLHTSHDKLKFWLSTNKYPEQLKKAVAQKTVAEMVRLGVSKEDIVRHGFPDGADTVKMNQALRDEGGWTDAEYESEMTLMAENAMSRFVGAWAGSSNDNSPRSLGIQESAKKVFGLSQTAPWQSDAEPQKNPLFKPFLQAQYNLTQQDFKARGITEVTLFRGMAMNEAAFAGLEQGAIAKVMSRPLSSWSTNPRIAKGFASETNLNQTKRIVLRQTVPVEKIYSTPFTGFGCYGEEEMVVLGGTSDAAVFDMGVRVPSDFEE